MAMIVKARVVGSGVAERAAAWAKHLARQARAWASSGDDDDGDLDVEVAVSTIKAWQEACAAARFRIEDLRVLSRG